MMVHLRRFRGRCRVFWYVVEATGWAREGGKRGAGGGRGIGSVSGSAALTTASTGCVVSFAEASGLGSGTERAT